MIKEKMSTLLVLSAAVMWGCIGLFVRHLDAFGFDAMQITAVKCLVNAGLMLLFILLTDRGKLRIHRKDMGWFFTNAICSIYIFNTAYNAAITMISLSAAVVLLYTAPVFVMLMSVVFFHERFTKRKALCLVLCVGGSALVSGLATGMRLHTMGILLGLISGIGYACYSIFSGVIVRRYHPFTNVFYTFLIAGIAATLSCDMREAIQLLTGSGEAVFWMMSNSVITSFLPYITYTTALLYINPSKAAILASLEPVVATLVGVFVYKEMITLSGGLGILMVFAALVLSSLPETKEKASADAEA